MNRFQQPVQSLASQEVSRQYTIGIALGITAILCISIRPVLIKAAYSDLNDSTAILALRMAFCWPFALIMFVSSALFRRREGVLMSARDWSTLVAMGVFGFYVSSILDFSSLQFLTAGTSRLITYTFPTFVLIISFILLRRHPSLGEIGALLLTYGGLWILLKGGSQAADTNLTYGAVLAILSAFFFAVYLVLNGQIGKKIGAMATTSTVLLTGSTLCIVHFLFTREFSILDTSWRVYVLTACMALVSTLLPVYLTTEAMIRIGASRLSLLGALGPVLSMAGGVLIMGDSFGVGEIAGALLILTGVAWVSSLRQRAVKQA